MVSTGRTRNSFCAGRLDRFIWVLPLRSHELAVVVASDAEAQRQVSGATRGALWSTMAQTAPSAVGFPPTFVATILSGTGATGVEAHTAESLGELSRAGVPAELVTPHSWHWPLALLWFAPRRVLDKVAPTASVVWYRWSHGAALRRVLARRLRNRPGAVVYAQCPVSARAALRARRDASQQVVMAVHFNVSQADEWAEKGMISPVGRSFRAIRRFEREVLQSVDALVYVSQAVQADVAGHVAGLEHVPSVVIPNFVRDGVRQRDPALAAPADLVTVGSLEPRKNQRFLLEVLAEAARLGRRFSLDIIGEGSSRPALLQRAHELGVADHVHFLGNRTDVRAQLPGHRLYVHASHYESFGIALIEAMSAGLPVLAGAVGGIPELFDDGRAGAFWPLDDPAEAARILVHLLEDLDALARAGASCRARFLNFYSADRAGPRLVRFLTTLERGSEVTIPQRG